ncbi:FAD/FMN-containing dehydrogenase [Micromonospora pattaloongensis]|uniref:FAD/FMN-containing dehydrogenase n=1 Tax=Micromonospora pattaloongensis TaxID=405436 RepID=A0A1H3R4J4_9ACTN|nr:FAD-binding and (Fe-S)-binding domain-containing protein [Micromonospora pattaloongensis]SDZ20762.1 FAD/FMN-containing dehydrogenase [Micromonospora pattaloongensis]
MAIGAKTVQQVPAKTRPDSSGPPRGRQAIPVGKLERDLARAIEGEVRFDPGSRAMYAHDASNFRQVPIGVVVPRTLEDVVATHKVCHRYGAPVVNRGGGTSLSGETVNYAVAIDHSKYLTAVGSVDPQARLVTCQNGIVNEQLNVVTGQHNLIFGPDPSSHSRCTIGGNIGNNSCGIHSVQSQLYGPGPRTSDNVHALEVVTYDGQRFWVGVNEEDQLDDIIAAGGRKGEIYAKLRDLRDRYADEIRAGYPSVDAMPRWVSGYNLAELLPENGFNVARAVTGTEGTCVTVLQATLMLTPAMLQRATVVIAYLDLPDAAEHTQEILDRWRPIGLEAIDRVLIEDQQALQMNLSDLTELPWRKHAGAWLLVQFGADEADQVVDTARRFTDWATETKGYGQDRVRRLLSAQDGGQSETVWTIREGGLGSTAFPHSLDHWPGWEDSAVPPNRAGDYVRDLRALLNKHGLRGALYGHFGQGCLHGRFSFDLRSATGIANYRAFLESAADLAASYGGSISGEHGDGQQRAELLGKQYSPALMQAMREFKLIWDPDAKMNPGKVVDAYRFDEDLNLGTDYNPARPSTVFAYAEDGNDFAHATLRCVGVGKCREPVAKDTICPSFQATHEEKYTTRGRARLLFEMLRGDVITDGWQSREVADGLDLCLACKGCTKDCPVNVDIPTYKAEFRYHHYKSLRRWRPRYAYSFGLIDQFARLAAAVPELVNLATQTPGLAHLVRAVGGIDQNRPLPRFAPMTLQQWFKRRGGTRNPNGRPVVLFPDTFNNHLHTDVGVACVEAIEAAGWQVIMPQGHICCGRPLYDYGFLDLARRYLHNVLDMLREHIRAGTPVVGMEPSCLAVFKDELTKILPHDDDAARLHANAYHFADFFRTFDIAPPPLHRQALLWGHCHHRATGGVDPELELLKQMGATVDNVAGGCCGLAGSWGFEKGKWQISLDCGEQKLLPAVRAAEPEKLIVANGFSCKTQIADAGTGRRGLHIGQVLTMARQHGPDGYRDGRPEDGVPRPPQPPLHRRVARVGAVLLAAALAGGASAAAAHLLRRSA